MLLHAMSLLVMPAVDRGRDAGRPAELIVLPPPCPLTIAPIDFSQADELIRRGYEDSRDYLESVEPAAPVPLPMTMHEHPLRGACGLR